MSNVVEGRERLEALAAELNEAGSKGTAQKIMNIVKDCLYRSHIGVAQGPKKVKRAKKAKPEKTAAKKHAPAKAAKKTEKSATKKAPAKTASPAKAAKAEKPAKVAKPKPEKAAAPKKEKVAKPKATPAAASPIPTDMDFPANI